MTRNRRPLVAMFAADTISQIGNQCAVVAIPVYVLITTGSATRTGLVGVVAIAPILLAAFVSGSLIRRLGFRRTSILADLAGGLAVAFIPLLVGSLGLAFWQLLGLVFLRSLVTTPGQTARQSLFPDVSVLAHTPLERANALAQSSRRLSILAGAPLAGVAIVLIGASNVLWLDAASFLLSAAIVGALIPSRVAPFLNDDTNHNHLGWTHHLLSGVQIIRQDAMIALLVITSTFGNAFGAALLDVAVPVYAVTELGNAAELGVMLGGFGGGALLGALLFAVVGQRLQRRQVFLASVLLGSIPFWIIATTPSAIVGVIALVFFGLASGPFGPIVSTIYQERVPVALRADFFGLLLALDNVTTPFALLVMGALIDRTRIGLSVGIVAAVRTLQSLVVVSRSSLKRMDRGAVDA